MRGYNVLSLFGGIETGYAALKDAGVPIENYWSSEIDKHAIKVTSWNYHEIVHLGDVKSISVANLPFIPDLLLAGFPCTDLSVAGKQGGFDNDRSGLFFEAVRILRECQAVNQNVLFLFENVPMAKRHEWVINEMLGLRPWVNNASLVSAQTRKRLWWSNIRTKKVGLFGEVHTDFPQPEDKGIFLKDILEKEVSEKYYLSSKRAKMMTSRVGKHTQIDGEKSICFTAGANSGGNHSGMDLIWQTGRGNNPGGKRGQNGKTPCVSANRWEQNNHVFGAALRRQVKNGAIEKRLEFRSDNKSNCVTQFQQMSCVEENRQLRRLTPVEVCRLFTLPDDFFQTPSGPLVAESHQYRLLGNGWVMKVVSHIFSFLPELQ